MNWTRINGIFNTVSEEFRMTLCVTKMAELTAISIKKFDSMDYMRWSLEIHILLEQKQVLGIVDGTEGAPNMKQETEFKACKK